MRLIYPPALALGVLVFSPGLASAQSTIGATLASAGAIQASDATVALHATIGQPIVGVSSVGATTLKAGFWYPSGPGSRPLAAMAPSFFGDLPPAEALQNEVYSATIFAQDPNGDEIAFGIDPPLPAGLTFTDNGDGTATIGGKPGQAAVGPAVEYTVEASDGVLIATLVFSLEVIDVNDIVRSTHNLVRSELVTRRIDTGFERGGVLHLPSRHRIVRELDEDPLSIDFGSREPGERRAAPLPAGCRR